MNIATATALGAAILTLGATTAAAQEPRSETVEYSDLDLQSTSGMRILNGRLERAISRVCYRPAARSIKQRRSARNCRRELAHQTGQLVEKVARGTVTLAGAITIRVEG